MAYTVLARRYRSASFDQVVGQEPIARTLQNAIATGRVAHAYLFTGTRGVGKTSMARLFARALNAPDTIPGCPKPPDAKKGDFPTADVQERMAEAIMRGDDLNVIEIDGASNNSVDQARQLIAGAGLSPTANARFKVYIIDEVHMLSTAAFNALLKTMEEPPAHVKFILCTTEVHKVPVTIQSRCQRFDFRNIPGAQIAAHLKGVLAAEKIKADEQVVWHIARLGNGSMRDALSLLDRLLAAGQQPLTPKLLETMLGLPPQEQVAALVDAFADGDAGAALRQAAALLDGGISQDQLAEVLVDRLRQLMVIAACGKDSDLVELADDARGAAAEQAARFDTAGLVHMIALCDNLHRNARLSTHPRALLDATIVRLALAEKMADVTALLQGPGKAGPAVTGTTARSAEKKKSLGPESVRPPLPSGEGRGEGIAADQPLPPPPPEQPSAGPTAANAVVDQSGAAKAAPVVGDVPAPQPETAQPIGAPDISPTDPQRLWGQVQDQLAAKASSAWIRNVALRHLEGRRAVIAPLPGHRELNGFLNPQRCEALGRMLGQLLRRPVKVELEGSGTESPTGSTHDTNARDQNTSDKGGDDAGTANAAPPGDGGLGHARRAGSPLPPNGKTARSSVPRVDEPPMTGQSPAARMDRQQVLALPLVRKLMEVFEASIIGHEPESSAEPHSPAAPVAAPRPSSADQNEMPVPDEPEE